MLTEPEVCVITINYFAADKTIKCLECIRNEPIKTIYVLDNSADHDQKLILTEYIKRTSDNFSSSAIIFLSFNENLGFSRGINRVLEYDKQTNKHTHYCLLNNDTLPEKGFILPLYQALNNKETILVSPKIHWGDTDITYFYYNQFTGINTSKEFPFSFPYISGCCLMFRHDLLINQQLLDEDFFMYGEDIELCWRAHKEQKKIQVVMDSVIYHEGSGSARIGSIFYEYYVARSHILLINKLQKLKHQRILSYIGKASFLFFRALVRTWRYKSIIPTKAFFMCWFDYKLKP